MLVFSQFVIGGPPTESEQMGGVGIEEGVKQEINIKCLSMKKGVTDRK